MAKSGSRRFFLTLASTVAWLLVSAVFALPCRAAIDRSASQEVMIDYVQALLLDVKGDYWGAIEQLRKVMAAAPNEPAVRFSISQSYRHLAVLDSARVYGESAVKYDPENPHYLRYLAALAHDMRDFDRAAELYGKASVIEPGKPALLYRQGLELMSANRPAEAIDVLEKAVKVDPYKEEVLLQILKLQVGFQRYPEAIDSCNKLLQLDPGNPKYGKLLAELYVRSGQDSLATVTFRKLVETDPVYVPGWAALFDFYIGTGRTEEFRRESRAFLDATQLPPEQIDDLARLFVARSGKHKQYQEPAREFLDEIMNRRPGDSRLFVLKGVFELMQNRDDEAHRLFGKAVQLDPANAEAWEYLISAHISKSDKPQASELLRQARLALPDQLLRWKLLEGSLLMRTGSPRQAATVLEQAVRIRTKEGEMPLLIRAHINLALAYDMLGLKKRSKLAYAMVLRLDPHNAMAMNNMAYMLAEEGVKLRQALLLATNAVLLDPDNAVYLDTLGWVNYKLGNYDRARILLEKAVESGIDEPEIYQHLAEVYRKLGNEPKARQMFEKAKGVKKR